MTCDAASRSTAEHQRLRRMLKMPMTDAEFYEILVLMFADQVQPIEGDAE